MDSAQCLQRCSMSRGTRPTSLSCSSRTRNATKCEPLTIAHGVSMNGARMMQAWANYLDGLRRGGKVVRFRVARGGSCGCRSTSEAWIALLGRCPVAPSQRVRELNSCRMGELRVDRDLPLRTAMVKFQVRQGSSLVGFHLRQFCLPLTRPATGRDVRYKHYGQFTRTRTLLGTLRRRT